ncbi:DUF3047 domain-containing protein [Methylotenera sp. 1P/1]|uniref:DUF3047 domain-containing protein n=1 Tax=Methylotenera sp. 1P/1 TaxID=1131551 RepID=UPI00036ADD36|nr:DUF3047 domain-containing protein [Methylotenera sp. 1P/1]
MISKKITLTFLGLLITTTAYAEQRQTDIPSHQQFENQIRSDIGPLAGKEVASLKVLYLSGDIGPWVDTGLNLDSGDHVTMLLNGKMWLSRSLNLSYPTPISVWAKQGEMGSIFHGTRDTNTFVASQSKSSLRLKLYPSERWLDTTGKYAGEPAPVNPDAGGGVSVALIKWAKNIDVETELNKLTTKNKPASWAVAELDRQKNQKMPPEGWNYIWELTPSEIFYDVPAVMGENAPKRAIELRMHDDVTIIEKESSFELTPDTKLGWKWKVDELPSAAPENTIPTHDYISIAVKFDNGKDLTFFWSRNLPVDSSFHCPLSGWTDRETHVVARSGTADLGKWLGEEKNILDYYKKAVGGPLPKRITHVWLIGVSFLQHGKGLSQFGDIKLYDGKNQLLVY